MGVLGAGCGPAGKPGEKTGEKTRANPFEKASTLPFQAPDFRAIRDSDYQPAIEEGMTRHLAEIRAIADQTAPPTFENTIVAMEKSGRMLDRTLSVFYALVQANTNPVLDKVQADEAPRIASHMDAIFLDAKLFGRVKALYEQRAGLKLDAFAFEVRAGAVFGKRRPGGDHKRRTVRAEATERPAAVDGYSVVVADELIGQRLPFWQARERDIGPEEQAQFLVHRQRLGGRSNEQQGRQVMVPGYRRGNRGPSSLREPEAQRTLPNLQQGLDRFGNCGRKAGKLSGQAGKPSSGHDCPSFQCSIGAVC